MKADEKIYDAVVKFITDSRFEITEKKEETYCDRLDVKSGIFRCNVNVFNFREDKRRRCRFAAETGTARDEEGRERQLLAEANVAFRD